MDLSFLAIAGGTASIGMIITFWKTLKSWAVSLQCLFLMRVRLDPNDEHEVVLFLMSNGKLLKTLVPGIVYTRWDWVKGMSTLYAVPRLVPNHDYALWWKYKKHIVRIRKGLLISDRFFPLKDIFSDITKKHDSRVRDVSSTGVHFWLHHCRGSSFNNDFNNRPSMAEPPSDPSSNSPSVSMDSGIYSELDIISAIGEPLLAGFSKSDFGQQYIPKEVKFRYIHSEITTEVLNDVKRWCKSEKWYAQRGIPWRRGYLFYGLPGSGKTQLCVHIAETLNIPIHIMHLSTMNNSEFERFWGSTTTGLRIVLFEDFDSVFNNRIFLPTEGKMQSGLSFDTILNAINGVDDVKGLCLIITANDIKNIDPALAQVNELGSTSRPGRIDKVIKFETSTRSQREAMANRICVDIPESEWKHLIEAGQSDAMAQFQERCSSLALNYYWEHKEKVSDGY